MTITPKEELDDLEFRVLDMEIARLKKMHAKQSVLVTTTAKPATKDCWNQWRSTRQKGGRILYEHRTTSGGWTAFPADRAKWPSWVRAEVEKVEEFDKRRTVGGRMISAGGGTVKMG
jgi:hypothetical protein